MAAVSFSVERMPVSTVDMVLTVTYGPGKLGELRISKGGVDWWPRGSHTKRSAIGGALSRSCLSFCRAKDGNTRARARAAETPKEGGYNFAALGRSATFDDPTAITVAKSSDHRCQLRMRLKPSPGLRGDSQQPSDERASPA